MHSGRGGARMIARVMGRGTAPAAAPAGARGMASMAWRMIHGAFDFEASMKTMMPGVGGLDAAAIDAAQKQAPAQTRLVEKSDVKISTLENGARVVSIDQGALTSSVGMFWNAGSRYETQESAGAAHVMELLAFKGSLKRSKLQMTRDMERLGANFGTASTRDVITFAADGMRSNALEMFHTLAEASMHPAILDYDREPAYTEAMQAGLTELAGYLDSQSKKKDPDTIVMENLHAAAFEGNTLGLPMWAAGSAARRLTPQVLSDYVRSYQSGDRVAVCGINVEHEALVDAAAQVLSGLPPSSGVPMAKARYTGGERRVAGSGGSAAVSIAFEACTWSDDDLVAQCVLNTLLGGGGSFSSGGPGKGMYTKLYTNCLNGNDWLINISVVNQVYQDSGLFGISATADADRLPQLVDLVMQQCAQMAKGISSQQLSRAKNMAASGLLINLESRGVLCEDMGRQVLATGTYVDAAELVAQIQKVTVADLERVAERMLAKRPTVSIYGELYGAPSFLEIEHSLKSNTTQTLSK